MEEESTDLYDFEKGFDHAINNFGHQALEEVIGSKKKDRRKKKLQTRYSEIEIDKSHKFLVGKKYDKISPFLQEKMVYAGQLTNYAEGVFMLHYFYGIDVSQTQHFRITNHYGKLSNSIIEEESPVNLEAIKGEVYVQCDGSMILTRTEQKEEKEEKKKEEVGEKKEEEVGEKKVEEVGEEKVEVGEEKVEVGEKKVEVREKELESGGWEEIKLCRVYQSSDKLISGKRGWI
ncbi:MAG: hypothetical protein LBG80_10810, partial [Bacteroidales bacterium]|nr:hypothetical protein [Bacteroidales bacterium]